jgi:hypothetical protein
MVVYDSKFPSSETGGGKIGVGNVNPPPEALQTWAMALVGTLEARIASHLTRIAAFIRLRIRNNCQSIYPLGS